MKPRERAKALCDEFGILPTYEDYCKRAEAFIEAAERVARRNALNEMRDECAGRMRIFADRSETDGLSNEAASLRKLAEIIDGIRISETEE